MVSQSVLNFMVSLMPSSFTQCLCTRHLMSMIEVNRTSLSTFEPSGLSIVRIITILRGKVTLHGIVDSAWYCQV